jgi:hypothetical protein
MYGYKLNLEYKRLDHRMFINRRKTLFTGEKRKSTKEDTFIKKYQSSE